MENTFSKRFKLLNERQRLAVETTEGPVMVIAGPGTGKTELLALRVAHLLQEGLTLPQGILCLTFTDNAALNMRERLQKLIGEDAYRVQIFTFHSFASYIMGRFPEYFWGGASFVLADDIARAEIFERLFKSLPHGHVFSSFHPAEGFVYLRDVKERIRHIKNGGYTSKEYGTITEALLKEYEEVNHLFKLWPDGRLSIKRLPEFKELENTLKERKDTTSMLLYKALMQALLEAEEINKTEPIASFKKKYLVSNGEVVLLKDFHNKDKLLALAEMYREYEKEMEEKGYYDFDDMILSVSHVLKENAFARTLLEEEYHYIMIDEFQDTNEAQMDLVRFLTGGAVHEGRPNILVVGDDDQAIYKFQGAEVSHLMRFRESLYQDVTTIVLDKNYRSTKDVLSLARKVVVQGKGRLENHFEDIKKDLTPMNSELKEGSVSVKLFETDGEEYAFVARKIKETMLASEKGDDIAVLARGHKELRALIPYLERAEVPFEYTKKANVFDEVHVRELVMLSEYLSSFMENTSTKKHLFPEIISFPFFGISRKTLFELSVTVKREHEDWLASATKSSDDRLRKTSEKLIDLAGDAKTMPLLQFLKKVIEETPFKDFYFSKELLHDGPSDYIKFLSSLRTFLDAISLYKEGEMLTAKDVGTFVDLHKTHDVSLNSLSISVKKKGSIKLMTAHASKGLEFGSVFIISAKDTLWAKGRRGSKVPLPFPLKALLEPAGDDVDDFLRLFYVALTRGKHSVYVTSHAEVLRFVSPFVDRETEGKESSKRAENESDTESKNASTSKNADKNDSEEEIFESALSLFKAPLVEDEKEILHKLVEGYQMPVTHLQNFCNVLEGGPLYFLEQNLLRFPQPMNPSAVFGSAVHKVIEEMVKYKKYNAGENSPLERLLLFFDKELSKGRLPKAEEEREKKRGHTFLKDFYNNKKDFFLVSDIVEADFSKEGVVIDGAHLTGKIDFLRKEEGGKRGYTVIDFKTGDSYNAWNEAKLSEYEKHKLHKYRQQLIVYKLLLEGSKSYQEGAESLSLFFVEDKVSEGLSLHVSEEETKEMKELLKVVYKKIVSCDFPDISSYEKSFKGVLQFEKDLREGKI